MAGSLPIVYADTCVFISMLTGEQRKGNESQHVQGFGIELDRREVVAVKSALTETEILDCTLTAQQQEVMQRLLRPPKVQIKDVSKPILGIAREIREYYLAEKKAGNTNLPTVETPDAIHLATAIYYDCPVMFTFDENDRAEGTRPKRGLISLSENVAGRHPLKIEAFLCCPRAKCMTEQKTQSDKFKEAARDLEADESEKRWDERLKKVVKPSEKKPD